MRLMVKEITLKPGTKRRKVTMDPDVMLMMKAIYFVYQVSDRRRKAPQPFMVKRTWNTVHLVWDKESRSGDKISIYIP